MSEQENKKNQPNIDMPYKAHDMDDVHTTWRAVPRSPRQGETDGWIDERLWIELGRGVKNGREYAVVANADEGIQKEVFVEELEELARNRREKRLAAEGTNRVVKKAADTPVQEYVHLPKEISDEDKIDWVVSRSEFLARRKAEAYELVIQLAQKLSSGAFDPSIMYGSIMSECRNLLKTFPQEAETVEEIESLLNNMDKGRYFSTTGHAITRLINQRLEK
jgi:hypothetical protein